MLHALVCDEILKISQHMNTDGGFVAKLVHSMTRKVEDLGTSLLASAGEVTFTNYVSFRIARVAFDSDESKVGSSNSYICKLQSLLPLCCERC